jgi:UDP-N-acetylmuramoyl-L-alanyl-D-glutamate--2,6-diaminopimelate ligase
MKLFELVCALPSYQIQNKGDLDITSVTDKSSEVIPGSLFVAYPGVNVEGARYIPEAIQRGAAAIVTQSPVTKDQLPTIIVPDARSALAHLSAAFRDYPSRKLRVVGVTGTDGKTTTCMLTATILKAAGHAVGTITTVSAQIGDGEVDTGFHTTTPDAPQVQEYLSRMVDAGVEYAVIEATSHGLAQRRLDAIDFDIAVVTNITHEHLDYHKTFENYRGAKASLFRSLAASYRKARTAKVAVLNADDEQSLEYLLGIACDERLVYSSEAKASPQFAVTNSQFIFARDIQHSSRGLSFTVAMPFGELPITSKLIGRYNVSNILAAIGVGIARRVPFDAMREGIAQVHGVVGRMQVIQSEPFAALVDFAHTPNSLRVALEAARELAGGKVIVVFGCAGLRDVEKRAMMGKIAGKLADRVVITAEDPRTESLEAINAQIAQGLERAGRRKGEDYFVVDDRAEAIAFAIKMARAGDLVIVTGKGHERSMCFGTTEYPWSDQDAVRTALQAKS